MYALTSALKGYNERYGSRDGVEIRLGLAHVETIDKCGSQCEQCVSSV